MFSLKPKGRNMQISPTTAPTQALITGLHFGDLSQNMAGRRGGGGVEEKWEEGRGGEVNL